MSIRVRRGTDVDRLTVVLDDGEIAWTTDTNKFYVGDGVTLGGIEIGPGAIGTFVPTSRTITINGNTQDLSADRTWSVGTVTSIATSGLLSGGTITTSGTVTTSINTNKLVGRTTAGTGVMEEITVGTGLTLSSGTLSATAQVPGFEQHFLLMGA